jgi:SpoVK/Ycf46/Vps4 family AAA+-type ATPase
MAMVIPQIYIHGLPSGLAETDAAIWRSRFDKLTRELIKEQGIQDIALTLTTTPSTQANHASQQYSLRSLREPDRKGSDEATVEERANQYRTRQPLFSFDFLILPAAVKSEILSAVSLIHLESKVFDEWNLRKIEPFPRTALNFHGEPGTGKTLAAHAVANQLGRPILVASYAQIESKFHGDGPKNVDAIFYAAERDKAVLFIDEADSLLSKRLTNVTQGSEQAINSMRSQLLICLEQFRGVVIFATNLVTNYDRAFETRVRSVHFPLPGVDERLSIWRQHLLFDGGPPLDSNVSIIELSKIEHVCGRDIKNAVIDAAVRAAQNHQSCIRMNDLTEAVDRLKSSRIRDDSLTISKEDLLNPKS